MVAPLFRCWFIFASMWSPLGQAAGPETQKLRISAGPEVDPAQLNLKTGDQTWYLEWTSDPTADTTIQFASISPCLEGHLIEIRQGTGTCTLRPKVCLPNAAYGRCEFSYLVNSRPFAIVIEAGYQPGPPQTLKGAFRAGYSGMDPDGVQWQPGDSMRVRLRSLNFQAGTQVYIDGAHAIVARIISLREADIIVPVLKEGVAEITVRNGDRTESAGRIVIKLARNRRLTLSVNADHIALVGAELHRFDPPPCVHHEPSEGAILYNVRIDGDSTPVACGVVRELTGPEYFTKTRPYRKSPGALFFTIVVPRNLHEKVYFTPGDLNQFPKFLKFRPDRPPTYEPIEVPY